MKARNRVTARAKHLPPIREDVVVSAVLPPCPLVNPRYPTGDENMYWDEIAALCVDGESLRLQKRLLRKALCKKRCLLHLQDTEYVDVAILQKAVEYADILSSRVTMLST